ncbi:MAG TPA: nuclear transport factor 2 family protein [Verrucomicrobiae bacterium]|nr:nuclear transport factor 2 family protein [Verrucomicrobiae bacterium]
MRRILHLLPILALLAGGCASTNLNLNAPDTAEQKQIHERLTEIFDAATKKDFPRLDSYHFYGPKFTRFGTESPDREDALAAREAEHAGLNAVSGMKVNLQNLKIDVFQNVGVATFILQYSFVVGLETVEREAKGTLVLVNDAGSWKIVHEHFSARHP